MQKNKQKTTREIKNYLIEKFGKDIRFQTFNVVRYTSFAELENVKEFDVGIDEDGNPYFKVYNTDINQMIDIVLMDFSWGFLVEIVDNDEEKYDIINETLTDLLTNMNNQKKEKQKLIDLINIKIDKVLNKEHFDNLKEYYEEMGIDGELEKSVLRGLLEKKIDKYSEDYSQKTYWKMIEHMHVLGDNVDLLESEVFDEFIEELRIHQNITDPWVELFFDEYIGCGFLMDLLHYFRLFYNKWYLESEINRSVDLLGETLVSVHRDSETTVLN
jgi:hypothetical protein